MPVNGIINWLHVVPVNDLRHDSLKLHPAKTVNISSRSRIEHLKGSYFRPMQERVPYENGWLASRLSVLFSPIHLSDLNVQGSLKLAVDMLAAKVLVETTVCRSLLDETIRGGLSIVRR